MARSLRIEYPGAFYHITSRGNARQNIFENKKDYLDFLNILKENIERYNWECYAYCLMTNHYHIFIKTLDPNLSQGMRQLNGVYTQKFNYSHKRVGHLFQGRYNASLIEAEKYFYELVRYIVLNPVRANMVKNIDIYPWSSHKEMIFKREEGIIERDKVIDKFENLEEYKEYISQKNIDKDIWEDLKGGLVLGSINFVENIKEYIRKESKKSKEIKKAERFLGRPELKEIFKEKGLNLSDRNKLIYRAYRKYGYGLSEIGRQVNLHNSFVGKIVKKMVKSEEKDEG